MKFKKSLALLLAVLVITTLVVPTVFAESGVVHITSAEDLNELARNCVLDTYSEKLNVVLDNDIDFGGEYLTPIPTFSGTFNGNGHTISNFVYGAEGSHQGVFRYVEASGVVKNLTVSANVEPDGSANQVGGIVGTNRGTIEKCAFVGNVLGKTDIGGVVGENYGKVTSCTSSGKIIGKQFTGGICGYNGENGVITSCVNAADINTTITESTVELESLSVGGINDIDLVTATDGDSVSDSGGIVGATLGTVKGCVNNGTVGYQHYGYNVGGIAGRQSGYIDSCENYGFVYGRQDVGGIVGQMEPYMELKETGTLADELNTLHDLVNDALEDYNGGSDDITDSLDNVKDDASSAATSITKVATEVGQFADKNIDTTNELISRLEYFIDNMQPVTRNFSKAADNFSQGMIHLDNCMDDLEMEDEELADLHAALDDLSTALNRMGDELAYLSYVGAAYYNQEGSGNINLDDLTPSKEEQERVKREYGYDYDINVSSTKNLKKAISTALVDLISDTAKASKARSKIVDILDNYYLTPVHDTDGDGIADQCRLDYAQDEGSIARDYFTTASDYLAKASDGLDSLNTYFSNLSSVQFVELGSEYYKATDTLYNSLNSLSSNLGHLNDNIDDSNDVLTNDLMEVNDQFNVVLIMLSDAINGVTANEILDDQSASDELTDKDGKVYRCVNHGEINGDSNAGGIAGAMGIEYELDMEGEIASAVGANGIFSTTYRTKCVVRNSVNDGSISSKKNRAGGICGNAEMGMIIGCEGYGRVEADSAYAGGIVGYSYTVVKDSYAMCNITSPEYAGGIAGYGTEIKDCHTLVGFDDVNACCGTIAGYADVNVKDAISGNTYVNEYVGAIDGISYSGKAEGISYAKLVSTADVPDRFKELKLTFVANGDVIKEISFVYGGSVDASEIPEVPGKTDYSGSWPEYDYSALYFSDTIEAVYVSKRATLAVADTRNGSPMSIALVEGKFSDDAELMINEYTGSSPSAEVIEKWVLRIDDGGDAISDYTVRFLPPVLDDDTKVVDLYVLNNGVWEKVSTHTSGSYLVFEASGDTVIFAVAESESNYTWMYVASAGLVIVIAIVFIVAGNKKKAKKKAKAAEE